MTDPMRFTWAGDSFVPLPAFRARADRDYVTGATYQLTPHEDRSDKTHRHEFAFIREAWEQLPDGLMETYPTPEALRKRALVAAGFCTETLIDAGSNAAALRVAAAIRSFPGDDFPVVVVRGPIVSIRRAKSQSYRAMGRQEFQASKKAIIEIISDMIGVTPEALTSNARRAA